MAEIAQFFRRKAVRNAAWRRRLAIAATCAFQFGLFLSSPDAMGQTRLQDRIDSANVRRGALLGTSPAPANPTTTGSLTTFSLYGSVLNERKPEFPLQYNINGTLPFNYFNQNGGTSPGTAAETTPELQAGFLVHPGNLPFQFSGYVDASSDRYTDALVASDADKLSGSLRIDLVSTDLFPDRGAYTPFISYSPQWSLTPFFQAGNGVTQDLAVGLSKLWDFRPDWRFIPMKVPAMATWEVGAQTYVQRRFVDSGPSSTALSLSPSIKWSSTSEAYFPNIDPDLLGVVSVSLAATVTHRWYDLASGIAEEVWAVAPTFTIAWVLPRKWFGSHYDVFGTPELDFQAAYTTQSSTVAGNGFTQWSFGPVLRSSWSF